MSEWARCETCNNGFKSDGNGGCVPCSSGEFCCANSVSPELNCIECDESGNGCGKCSSGYYIDDSTGSCVPCGPNGCPEGDTLALRHTISSLCSLNKVGQFASCCGNYENGASITLEDTPARSCFIDDLASTTGSVLTSLFAICFIFVLFFLFDDCHCFVSFFIFRSFYQKGLSVLGKDVFSSLTNLQRLFSLPPPSLSSIHFVFFQQPLF